MPKWKKDESEFTVGVNYNETRGYQSSIPKPVMSALGDPKQIKFTITPTSIEVSPFKANGETT